MKAELEEDVKSLGFEKTVIVRPGLLVGDRRESRPAEAVMRGVAKVFGGVSAGLLKDWWAQDVDVVGRAAVTAGLRCLDGQGEGSKEGVWVLNQADVVRLGRTEWKD